jgi:hypothetical protein
MITLLAVVLTVSLVFFRLNTKPLLGMLNLFMLAPVMVGFWLWIKMFGAAEDILT